MGNDIDTIYFFIALIGLLLGYLIITNLRPKTIIHIGMPGKPKKRVGHLKYETEHLAGEFFLDSQGNDKPIARTAVHEKLDASIIRIHHGDLNDESNHSDYRMRGYVTSEGLIFRQFNTQEEPQLVGYTARPSNPTQPTTKGERNWRTLWLKRSLHGYLGEPKSTEEALKMEVSECYLDGFILKKEDEISAEAKSCAFSILYGLYSKKEKADNIYQENKYGWKDTALLSALIFTPLYLCYHYICTYVFNVDIIGTCPKKATLYTCIYFIVWFLVRWYKIHTIEEGHSIQPKIDLINKSIGLKWTDKLILLFAFIGFYYYNKIANLDYYPVFIPIILAICQNGRITSNPKPWKVMASYQDEEEDLDSIAIPKGEIPKRFSWSLDPSCHQKLQGELVVNFDADYMTLLREENPFSSQRKISEKNQFVYDLIRISTSDTKHIERVQYIAHYIATLCKQEHISELDQLQFTLDFVQEPNIEFMHTADSQSLQFNSNYLRLPDETLFDQEGSFECKALLAALLLKSQGFDAIFVASTIKQHAGVAIRIKADSWTNQLFNQEASISHHFIEFNNKKYLYCETSGDGYRIGEMPENLRSNDFDVKTEMPSEEEEEDISSMGGFTI